jgi:hypothetical protein
MKSKVRVPQRPIFPIGLREEYRSLKKKLDAAVFKTHGK